jgi:hypothetical protein
MPNLHEGKPTMGAFAHALRSLAEDDKRINNSRPLGRQICGQFFGRELLLAGMRPGDGIRNCCLRFEDHSGEHSSENPDLDVGTIEGDSP